MESVLEFLRTNPGWWSLAVLFMAAALEYMLPPVPGDSICLAGSLLVVAGTWPFAVVAMVVITGGFVGSVSHFMLGQWLVGPTGELRGGRIIEKIAGHGRMDGFFKAFRKYGLWVLIVNRAFPGVRSVAFIAAGAARLNPAKTLGCGLISNIAFSLGLLTVGTTIGNNWEKISEVARVYQTGAMIVGLALVVTFIAVKWRSKRKAMVGSTPSTADGTSSDP